MVSDEDIPGCKRCGTPLEKAYPNGRGPWEPEPELCEECHREIYVRRLTKPYRWKYDQ